MQEKSQNCEINSWIYLLISFILWQKLASIRASSQIHRKKECTCRSLSHCQSNQMQAELWKLAERLSGVVCPRDSGAQKQSLVFQRVCRCYRPASQTSVSAVSASPCGQTLWLDRLNAQDGTGKTWLYPHIVTERISSRFYSVLSLWFIIHWNWISNIPYLKI